MGPGFNRWIGDDDDGQGGKEGGFSHFLFASPIPLPLLFSPFLLHLLSPLCGWFSWHFLPSALYSVLLSPWLGRVQIKPNRGVLSLNVVEYSGRPNTEKVRHPAEMTSPPLPFVSMASFSAQWVPILFHRALPPCQEKCLVVINTRHVLVNAGCCMKDANSISCFGRSPIFCWWQAKLLPNSLLHFKERLKLVDFMPLNASSNIWGFNKS